MKPFLFILLLFFSTHLFLSLGSGFSFGGESAITYDDSEFIFRAILFAIVSFSFVKFLKYNGHSTSIKDTLGDVRALHVLSLITFLASIGTSIFSSILNTIITDWAFRTEDYLTPLWSPMLIFVSFLMTILLLFVFHANYSNKLNKEFQLQQQEESKGLRDAIRVAPPPYFTSLLADFTDQAEDFLNKVADSYAQLHENHSNTQLTKDKKIAYAEGILDEQRKSMRAILTAFGRLARTYDNVNPHDLSSNIEYRANLMLCLENSSTSFSHLFPNKMPSDRFACATEGVPAYKLVIDSRLSVAIDKDERPLFDIKDSDKSPMPDIEPFDFKPDNDVDNALLPVYWRKNSSSLANYNMIGAPEAIFKGSAVFIPDTIKKIESINYFPGDIKSAALKYFRQEKKGRSIVSLPIATRHYKCDAKEATEPGLFFGSVNLYRNKSDIFSGHEDNFQFFRNFTRPLSIILARMTEIHLGSLLELHELKTK